MELFTRLKSEFDIQQSWTFKEDGKPAAKIVETANEWKADYIVVGILMEEPDYLIY